MKPHNQAGGRISLDSGSDIDLDDLHHFDEHRNKCPRRTFSISCLMAIAGLTLLILGIRDVSGLERDRTHWLVFMSIGLVLFTPGIYVSVRIIQAWRGVAGYSFDDIPTHEHRVLS
jgi:hypothetical protein